MLSGSGETSKSLSHAYLHVCHTVADRISPLFAMFSDRHVKALESRSQLLDAALASADEANRRWEDCRQLVDQLRIENAALRAALQQAQMITPNAVPQPPQPGLGSELPPPTRSNEPPAAPATADGADKNGQEAQPQTASS